MTMILRGVLQPPDASPPLLVDPGIVVRVTATGGPASVAGRPVPCGPALVWRDDGGTLRFEAELTGELPEGLTVCAAWIAHRDDGPYVTAIRLMPGNPEWPTRIEVSPA